MKKHKLSYRLAYWIVITSTVLTLIFSFLFLYNEYQIKLSDFENEISSIKKENNKALNYALWHYDVDSIMAFLEDTVDKKRVTYAEIKISNRYVKSVGIKKSNNIIEKRFEFTKTIDNHEYKIGELIVQGNISIVKEEIFDIASHMVLAEFLKMIFMSIFVVFLMKKLFVNTLEKLAEYTDNLSITNLDKEFKLKLSEDNKDEIGVVVNSFNNMRENLLLEIEKSNTIKKELISFRHAVEKSYNSIVITDVDRKITYVNDIFEKTTGYSREEVMGKNPSILKAKNISADFFKQMNEQLDNGLIWRGELVNLKKDGTVFYEKASIIPIFVDNELTNYLAIKLDITDYKNSEQEIKLLNQELEEKVQDRTKELIIKNDELNESIEELKLTQTQLLETEKVAKLARKNAEEANRDKSMFLANVSHELKTPLNGISGLVYLCKLKIKDSEVINNLTSINDYAQTLLRMIGDLLDTSKMEAKKIKIVNERFNLVEMLNSLNQLYTIECADKNIKFTLTYDENIPKELISDAVRLHQVITNLLNNAVKFTHQGSVKLNVSIKSLEQNKIKLKFEVHDDGIGIKEEELKTIFKAFYQTKDSLNYYAGGSGLGLNICKNIIEQMDGVIWAESQPEEGSSFFVLLDFEISNNANLILEEQNTQTKNIVIDNSQKQVLVVDDNHINREVLDGILKSIGITCMTAKNGLEALELVKNKRFDIVLTDIKMPVMDGCILSKCIREMYSPEELPIIAISANDVEKGMLCAKSCGVNDYIQKPINPESFLKKLSKYIGCSTHTVAEETCDECHSDILDVSDALNRFVNNRGLYHDALKSFVSDYRNSTVNIKTLLEEKRENEAIDYLHAIKGISANLSAKEFSCVASKLHDTLKYGKEHSALIVKYEKDLETLLDSIEEYLSETEEEKSNESAIENKDEVLHNLLVYCDEHNTKAIHFFKELSSALREDKLMVELEHCVFNYNFKQASEKINDYFKTANRE